MKKVQSFEEKNGKTSKNNISQEWISDTGVKYKFTFFDSNSHKEFKPIIQCYGICFNEKGEVAIGKNSKVFQQRWMLPGGRMEKGETPEQTLKRELLEELDLTVDEFKLIGAQKVEFPDDKTKESFYQLKYAVIIKEVKPLTPDPDNGVIWERKFVKPQEVDEYLKWGVILQHIVKKSEEWYEQGKKNNIIKKK